MADTVENMKYEFHLRIMGNEVFAMGIAVPESETGRVFLGMMIILGIAVITFIGEHFTAIAGYFTK